MELDVGGMGRLCVLSEGRPMREALWGERGVAPEGELSVEAGRLVSGCLGEAGSRSGVVLSSLPGTLNVLSSDSTLLKHPSSVPV